MAAEALGSMYMAKHCTKCYCQLRLCVEMILSFPRVHWQGWGGGGHQLAWGASTVMVWSTWMLDLRTGEDCIICSTCSAQTCKIHPHHSKMAPLQAAVVCMTVVAAARGGGHTIGLWNTYSRRRAELHTRQYVDVEISKLHSPPNLFTIGTLQTKRKGPLSLSMRTRQRPPLSKLLRFIFLYETLLLLMSCFASPPLLTESVCKRCGWASCCRLQEHIQHFSLRRLKTPLSATEKSMDIVEQGGEFTNKTCVHDWSRKHCRWGCSTFQAVLQICPPACGWLLEIAAFSSCFSISGVASVFPCTKIAHCILM